MRNPYLKIARRFGLDYGDVLHFSEWVEKGSMILVKDDQLSRGVRNVTTSFRDRNDYSTFRHAVQEAVDIFKDQKLGLRDMDGNPV